MRSHLKRFASDDRGATAIEYAIIATGVAVAIAATVQLIGQELNDIYVRVSEGFDPD